MSLQHRRRSPRLRTQSLSQRTIPGPRKDAINRRPQRRSHNNRHNSPLRTRLPRKRPRQRRLRRKRRRGRRSPSPINRWLHRKRNHRRTPMHAAVTGTFKSISTSVTGAGHADTIGTMRSRQHRLRSRPINPHRNRRWRARHPSKVNPRRHNRTSRRSIRPRVRSTSRRSGASTTVTRHAVMQGTIVMASAAKAVGSPSMFASLRGTTRRHCSRCRAGGLSSATTMTTKRPASPNCQPIER